MIDLDNVIGCLQEMCSNFDGSSTGNTFEEIFTEGKRSRVVKMHNAKDIKNDERNRNGSNESDTGPFIIFKRTMMDVRDLDSRK